MRHGNTAMFEGTLRKDALDKHEIVVASLGCNSPRTKGPRPETVQRLLEQDPDLLFFSGDQTYYHTEHTAGWIGFGLQYRELMRDRPTICIPDDLDVGHGNVSLSRLILVDDVLTSGGHLRAAAAFLAIHGAVTGGRGDRRTD